jgi:hypothetical protein
LFTKTKLFKTVTDPTRLTGVVVYPAAYKRDKELGIEGGFYEVRDGMGIYIDPKTKEFTGTYP